MSTRRFSERAESSLSTTEQDGHDQGMRETNLDTIDEAIPSTLQDSEVVVVDWVGDYVLDAVHRRVQERMAGLPLFAATIATITNHMQPPPGSDLTPRRCV